MTREQAQKLLPIIQAFAEGKVIQWRYARISLNWNESSAASHMDFDEAKPDLEWRIKPEPREFWLIKFKPSTGIYTEVRDSKPALLDHHQEIIHVKEVLDS